MPEPRALRRLGLILLIPLLAACVGLPRADPPPEVVARALHPNGGAPEITLLTVVHNRTGSGDHSALLIAGSHRVIYDPAGSFEIPEVPRRRDVLVGVSPAVENVYLGYHARETHHVLAQRLELTPAQAEAALAAAEAQRVAGPGMCAIRTGAVLRSVPGLEGLGGSPFPRRLAERFAAMPGVEERRIDMADVPAWARTRGPESAPPPLVTRAATAD